MFTDQSDYIVEQYIKPTKVRKRLINDERADILGNFDDNDDKFKKKAKKSNQIVLSEENPFADADNSEDENKDEIEDKNDDENEEDSEDENEDAIENDSNKEESNAEDVENGSDEDSELSDDVENHDDTPMSQPEPAKNEREIPLKKKEKNVKRVDKSASKVIKKSDLSDDQIQALIRGSSKKDRFVLYVTNINYSTTREALTEFFSVAGDVKSVRVPKVRRSAFAFVEMSDINGFKKALALHNRTLDNYTIKVQISEAGKKKSANKKNILKQKNRKLAEMRNETKQFQRSGKGYDKTIKKEIKQRKMQQDRRLAKKAAKK